MLYTEKGLRLNYRDELEFHGPRVLRIIPIVQDKYTLRGVKTHKKGAQHKGSERVPPSNADRAWSSPLCPRMYVSLRSIYRSPKARHAAPRACLRTILTTKGEPLSALLIDSARVRLTNETLFLPLGGPEGSTCTVARTYKSRFHLEFTKLHAHSHLTWAMEFTNIVCVRLLVLLPLSLLFNTFPYSLRKHQGSSFCLKPFISVFLYSTPEDQGLELKISTRVQNHGVKGTSVTRRLPELAYHWCTVDIPHSPILRWAIDPASEAIIRAQ